MRARPQAVGASAHRRGASAQAGGDRVGVLVAAVESSSARPERHEEDRAVVRIKYGPGGNNFEVDRGAGRYRREAVRDARRRTSRREQCTLLFPVHDHAASQTALMIAAYRGRASARADALFHDPWGTAIAGPEGEAVAREMDARFPPMELWVAVRTALLDAHLAFWTAPPWSIDQIVILGAGFDTRAARLAAPGRRFFEVDHPASQAEKRRRISLLPGYPDQAATHVACNFETDDFLDRLLANGFRVDRPAVILWEGVVPYLTEPAIRRTLQRVAHGCHERSVLLFDHLLKIKKKDGAPADPSQAFVGTLGEEVLFRTNDPVPMLHEEGFRHVRSVSFDEACLTLTGTYERAREFRFQRVVLASRSATGVP